MTMRNKILNGVATFTLVAAIAGTAGAAEITSGAIKIENHQVTTFNNNDFFKNQPYDAIWNQQVPATVSIAAPAPGFTWQLTFSFVYQEASWQNSFQWTGGAGDGTITAGDGVITASKNVVVSPFDSFTVDGFGGGEIPFKFKIVKGDSKSTGVEVFNADAGVLWDTGRIASFAGTDACPALAAGGSQDYCGGLTVLPANQMFLLFDDGGAKKADGSPDDDNHDDLIILLTATAVPADVAEPATLGLLGLGLAGLALTGRTARRRGRVSA